MLAFEQTWRRFSRRRAEPRCATCCSPTRAAGTVTAATQRGCAAVKKKERGARLLTRALATRSAAPLGEAMIARDTSVLVAPATGPVATATTTRRGSSMAGAASFSPCAAPRDGEGDPAEAA